MLSERRWIHPRMMITAAASLGFAATVAYAAGVTTIYRYDKNGNLIESVDVSSDLNNCGAIGTVCPAGNACCLGQCTTVATDPANCGACGSACYVPANGYATCSAASCNVACNASFTKCGTECVSTSSDASNCGGCGVVCSSSHVIPACVGGSCASGTCAAGYDDCNGNKQTDGCEVNLSTDVSNCGGCGVTCSTNHVTRACVGGSCASGTCAAGYGDCNGNKQTDGCERNLMSDPLNCGSCGMQCTGKLGKCQAGACVCSTTSSCSGGKVWDPDICACTF